ncbi:MAG TPA: hypothetical protein VMT85_19555 [Thermoanaerobaculia bacterium]|nr:hypothetical protein [Thermoanaerobaculia bacterium]
MSTPTQRSFGWPLAFTLVAIAVLLIAAGALWYTLRAARSVSTAALDSGRELLADVEAIASAFRTGTIHTSFTSHATEITGNSYLQFATLDETEVFERTDKASALWGQLQLPDVVVRATAPVQYTYYLDLDHPWRFELEDGERIRVVAPAIRYNQPSIDVSRLDYEIRAGSLLRNETTAVAALKQGLARLARERADDNVELVREIGRRKTEEFVENWLFRDFGQTARRYHVDVLFEDEVAEPLQELEVREGAEKVPADAS